MREVYVSVGAGFENDRRDLGTMAVQALAHCDGPRYLIFECLAERTLARQVYAGDVQAQIDLAASFIGPVWEACRSHDIRIVTNVGGFSPAAVARGLRETLGPLPKIVASMGDNLPIDPSEATTTLARNVYLGADGIVQALQTGADIVLTGRVADPSLVVGPVVHELGLAADQYDALATATLAGHLIECGTQVTGGYFADQDKEVRGLEAIGPPVAAITRDQVVLRKPVGGGMLSRATVAEQLLYEVDDPAAYITPDVVLDLSQVTIEERQDGSIQLTGAKGRAAPQRLKALRLCHTGWFAEGEISYVGQTSAYRGRMAKTILAKRLHPQDLRLELHEGTLEGEIFARLRLAMRSADQHQARHAVNELEALYLGGPAGGGGVRGSVTPLVEAEIEFVERASIQRPSLAVDL